jgi:hypothetical protein
LEPIYGPHPSPPFEGRVAQRESTSLTSRGSQVRSLSRPPSSLHKPRKPSSMRNRPFLRGSRRPFSTFPVSADNNGLSGRLLGLRSLHPKIPFLTTEFRDGTARPTLGNSELRAASEPIANSIRGFRTVGSIPWERRGAARHRCREANDLQRRL